MRRWFALLCFVGSAAALITTPSAFGASVGWTDGRIAYRADTGEANDVRVDRAGPEVHFRDVVDIRAESRCRREPNEVVCAAESSPVRIDLRDGNDRLNTPPAPSISIDGGAGSDRLAIRSVPPGGLTGGPPILFGGTGDDVL